MWCYDGNNQIPQSIQWSEWTKAAQARKTHSSWERGEFQTICNTLVRMLEKQQSVEWMMCLYKSCVPCNAVVKGFRDRVRSLEKMTQWWSLLMLTHKGQRTIYQLLVSNGFQLHNLQQSKSSKKRLALAYSVTIIEVHQLPCFGAHKKNIFNCLATTPSPS